MITTINPFWWPVNASLAKWAAHSVSGAYAKSYYRTIYFHRSGSEVDASYETYLSAIAAGIDRYRKARRVFPVMIGMEMLDGDACERVAEKLGGVPVFSSEKYDMYQLVSILRACDMMVSSRYHGIVTSMPGLVPSAGITMDERIRNLMRERGHADLLLEVDDPELEGKLLPILETLYRERDRIAEGIGDTVVRNLKMMARMGMYFEQHVQVRYPDFPLRRGLRSWEDYLPPINSQLGELLETFAAA